MIEEEEDGDDSEEEGAEIEPFCAEPERMSNSQPRKRRQV